MVQPSPTTTSNWAIKEFIVLMNQWQVSPLTILVPILNTGIFFLILLLSFSL
jgi:hypothetical protein